MCNTTVHFEHTDLQTWELVQGILFKLVHSHIVFRSRELVFDMSSSQIGPWCIFVNLDTDFEVLTITVIQWSNLFKWKTHRYQTNSISPSPCIHLYRCATSAGCFYKSTNRCPECNVSPYFLLFCQSPISQHRWLTVIYMSVFQFLWY